MYPCSTPLAALMTLSLATPCLAEPSNALEAVVVTATRTPGAPVNPAADVSVISEERLDLNSGRNIADVLAQEAGIEISSTGGPASLSGLFIRGTKPSQNVLLIDGFRLVNPTDNRAPLESLPLSAFGQIEVVRGAASSLYGSGAIGGAVQLFSRSGAERAPAFSGAITSGRYGSYRGEAAYGGTVGASQFNLAVGVDGNQGFSATNPDSGFIHEDDKDGFDRRSLVANLRHELSSASAIRLNVLSASGDTDFDTGIASGPRPYIKSRTGLLGATYEFAPVAGWRGEIKAGETRYDYEYHNAGFDFAPRTSSRQVGWMNYFQLPVGTLTLGVEHEKQRVAGEGVDYVTANRSVRSLLGQWLASIDRHRVQFSLRTDRWTGHQAETTGGLLYAYALTPAWSLTGNVGTAFRMPTFDDLYFPCQWWGCSSNPDLKPEESRNIELGTRYRQGGDEMRLFAFRNRIHNAIELDSAFVPQNIDSAIDGATVSWKRENASWYWNLSYTYQDARDADSDERLARRARHIFAGIMERVIGPWRIGGEMRSQDRRYSSFNAPDSALGGYAVANVYASYAVSPALSLQARIDNVADREYELVRGYNTPGRSLFLTLRYAAR